MHACTAFDHVGLLVHQLIHHATPFCHSVVIHACSCNEAKIWHPCTAQGREPVIFSIQIEMHGEDGSEIDMLFSITSTSRLLAGNSDRRRPGFKLVATKRVKEHHTICTYVVTSSLSSLLFAWRKRQETFKMELKSFLF